MSDDVRLWQKRPQTIFGEMLNRMVPQRKGQVRLLEMISKRKLLTQSDVTFNQTCIN